MGITQRFTDHPRSVDETYTEHCRVALGFSGQLAVASAQAAVHAVFPFLFPTSASRRITELHRCMTTGKRAVNAPRIDEPQTGVLVAVPDRASA